MAVAEASERQSNVRPKQIALFEYVRIVQIDFHTLRVRFAMELGVLLKTEFLLLLGF